VGADTSEAGRVVQRRELAQRVDFSNDVAADQHRGGKTITTMYDAVADRVDETLRVFFAGSRGEFRQRPNSHSTACR
jgi:hypothetical protein